MAQKSAPGSQGSDQCKGQNMGLLDTIKGLVRGHKKEVDAGIDKTDELAKKELPKNVDDKIDKAASTAKDQVNKL
jgi:antitoxin protein of toxin-antitoxin system